jgi:ABC-type transport system involved in multi-copper enzyme maturation permease subunit
MTYVMKEWKEQSRGKGLWLAFGMIAVISLLLLFQARALPTEHSFTMLLVSLFEMNMYLIPLISLFISSFTLMQEKEQKTMMILITRKESYFSFLVKKSCAVQSITIGMYMIWFIVLAILAKQSLGFRSEHFLAFLTTTVVLNLIFNQIGLFLGSICTHRMQLMGAAIFTWFLFVFLSDLAFLYWLPGVHHGNVRVFSILFFLDPFHASRLYLDTSLGLFSLEYMSRLMEAIVWMKPVYFMLMTTVFWVGLSLGAASLCRGRVWSK